MGDADVPLTTLSQTAGEGSFTDGAQKLKLRGGENRTKQSADELSLDSSPKEYDAGIARGSREQQTPPRARAPRKNARTQTPHQWAGQGRRGSVFSPSEHEATFTSYVNLFVDYVMVKAMRIVVNDFVRKYTEEDSMWTGARGVDVELEENQTAPVFSATDDSYIDVIDEEIQSTFENYVPADAPDDDAGSDDEKIRHGHGNCLNVNSSERYAQAVPVTGSESDEIFEMAAEHYLNTSLAESDEENELIFHETTSDARLANHNVNDDRYTRPRRTYEFEVDCETGMVSSREIVMQEELDDDVDEENYLNDNRKSNLKVEEVFDESIEGDSGHSFVDFGSDIEGVFQVIADDDDVDEAVYEIVDERDPGETLARKVSSFRARSPTKLPRAIREKTESHRRRCVSMGDAERYEFRDSPSSEFYSNPDAIDRLYVLPSPPRSRPGDEELNESGDDPSSSREELAAILDTPETLVTTRRPLITHRVMAGSEKASNNGVHGEQLPARDGRQHSDTVDELRKPCQPDTCSKTLKDITHTTSFNNNGRITEANSSDLQTITHLTSSNDESCSSSIEEIQLPTVDDLDDQRFDEDDETGDVVPRGHQLRRGTGARDSGIVIAENSDLGLDIDDGTNEEGIGDLDVDNERPNDDVNIFDYVRRRRGRLRSQEVNELLTDLAREKEAMDRMLRDARRAKEEFLKLQVGVKNLLNRLDSRTTAEV